MRIIINLTYMNDESMHDTIYLSCFCFLIRLKYIDREWGQIKKLWFDPF